MQIDAREPGAVVRAMAETQRFLRCIGAERGEVTAAMMRLAALKHADAVFDAAEELTSRGVTVVNRDGEGKR